MDVNGMMEGARLLSRPADEYDNNAQVEALWAAKAGTYADIHYNLICSAEPRYLQLTKTDDLIYTTFLRHFEGFPVDDIPIDNLKSPSAKQKWREFCEELKFIEDFSFGTLLRLNCTGEYSEDNTILVTRVQFFAIEIARNRYGLNNCVWEKFAGHFSSTNSNSTISAESEPITSA